MCPFQGNDILKGDPVNIVVGSTGLIGQAVVKVLAQEKLPFLALSRAKSWTNKAALNLQDRSTWGILPSGRGVVLVAGPSFSLRDCVTRPKETRAIQVQAVVDFSIFAAQRGLFPILLSSSFVYDGSRPDFGSQDLSHPACEYGRQKVEMETGVLEAVPESAVVRLTKVFGDFHPLVSSWWGKICSGRIIEAASDARLSPLGSQWVAETLVSLMKHPCNGIWHLSASDDISWFELAMKLADVSPAQAGRVSIRSLRQIDPSVEFVPLHGTLKPSWPRALSIPPSSLAIENLIHNITKSISDPDQNRLKLKS